MQASDTRHSSKSSSPVAIGHHWERPQWLSGGSMYVVIHAKYLQFNPFKLSRCAKDS